MEIKGLTFLGDVFLKHAVQSKIHFEDFILNLEYVITKSNIHPAKGKINLKAPESYLRDSFGKLPLAVNLANNHIFDFGQEGFDDTLRYLESQNIKYFGAGQESNNFNNPLIIELKGTSYGLIGYCCITTSPDHSSERKSNVSLIDSQKIVSDISSAKKQGANFIVVHLHWGLEEISYPKSSDIKIAKSIIEAGADLIIGHHAHVIQSVTSHLSKKIYFGLGNYIFPDLEEPSYYDGNSFGMTYTKKQLKRNKESLIVTVSNELSIEHRKTYFDGQSVRLKRNGSLPSWLPNENSFRIYLWVWYRYNLITKFLNNPKLPKMKHLKAFMTRK